MKIPLRILHLEDDPKDAELIRETLEAAGYAPEIMVVQTKADYLAQLDQGWEIILADYNLPQLDGVQALELLKKRGLDIPFILVSGAIGDVAIVTSIKAGAHDYVMKDHLEQLAPAVARELCNAETRRSYKKVDNALRESDALYRMLFEKSADGILIADIETRLFTYANPALCRMIGYTEEELKTMGVANIHPKDFLQHVVDEFEAQAQREKTLAPDIPCLRKDGTIVYADINTFGISLKGRECNVGFFRDITERKQAETVLRENEKQNYFQAEMLRNAPVIAAFHDRELNLVWANKAYEEATGLTVQAMAGRKCYSAWGLSNPCRHCPVMKAVESGEASKAELTPLNQDHWPETQGSWLASAAPVRDQDGRIIGAIEVAIDISESKLKEKQEQLAREVLESLTRLTDAEKTIGDIMQLIKNRMDFEAVGIRLQEGDDYPYFEASGFSEDFLLAERYLCERNEAGEVVRDATGNPVLECMCGNVLRGRTDPALPFFTAYGSFWSNSTTQLLATTSEADRQARTRNRCNGEGYESVALIPLNADGEIIGLLQLNDRRPNRFNPEMIRFFEGLGDSIGIAFAQKRAAEEIYKLARFPSENPNPVLRVSKDGIIVYCNKPGDQLLKAWKCRIGEALPEELCAKVMEVSRSGTITKIKIECDDRTFSTTLAPIEGKGYVNIYGKDITERKKVEEDLRQSEEQLRQAHKMEAIGRLAGGIAHDFNNLMTVITGFSELTFGQLPEESPLRGDIETVKNAAFRAGALTRQLLAFSRQQALQPQILNLNETVNNLDKMLRRIIGEDIQIVTRLAEKILRVKADPGQIEQVIMNLVVNARDAMPDGGTITIITQNVILDEDEAAIIPEAYPGHFIRLCLEDTGAGIDPATIEHIFEPFFTTKKVGEGTGLGLSTVYGIVKQHDGWINVYSKPGEGSVFNMYLPAFEVGTGWETEETGSREPPRGDGEKILVVEDEKGVRNFIVRTFRQYGYDVFEGASIAKGEKIFNEHPGGIDLLFTDMLLTDGNGFLLAQQLHGQQPDLAVLLSSGYSGGHFRLTAEEKETFRLLQKPYAIYDLLSAVKEVLRERAEKPAGNDAIKN